MGQLRVSSMRALGAIGMIVGLLVCEGQSFSVAESKSASPVVGVWQVAEVTTTGPNGHKNASPQPGLYIFAASHYAQERVTSDTPRAELPTTERTDKQVADAFGPFNANAGSYEVKGNEIWFKRVVAKSPATMKAGNFEIDTFRMEGKNSLWLTPKETAEGQPRNPTTVKLTRIE